MVRAVRAWEAFRPQGTIQLGMHLGDGLKWWAALNPWSHREVRVIAAPCRGRQGHSVIPADVVNR